MLRRMLRMVPVAVMLGPVVVAHAETRPPCEEPLLARPFVYRIGRGADVSHLVGSIHAGVRIDDFPAAFADILDAATDLTLEVRPPARPRRRVKADQADARRGDSPALSSLLDEATFARLRERLAHNGMPPGIADELSPFGAIVLSMDVAPLLAGQARRARLEPELARRFALRRIFALETAARQRRDRMSVMDLDLLKAQLDSPPGDPEASWHRYRRGDEAELTASLERARAATPRYHAVMHTERNARWLGRIAWRLRQPGRHVVVVGNVHLFGEDGLLRLLRDRGLTIERGL